MGHICYYVTSGDQKAVFTGDTLVCVCVCVCLVCRFRGPWLSALGMLL